MISLNSLSTAVFADPDNDLANMVRAFLDSGDPYWHIDRHVTDDEEARRPSPELVQAGCAVALLLGKAWAKDREAVRSPDVLISQPVVIIDDECLQGTENSPPPHVYICLARDTRISRRCVVRGPG
jgi:hypothetical protein